MTILHCVMGLWAGHLLPYKMSILKKATILAHEGRRIAASQFTNSVKKSGFEWWRRGITLHIHLIYFSHLVF